MFLVLRSGATPQSSNPCLSVAIFFCYILYIYRPFLYNIKMKKCHFLRRFDLIILGLFIVGMLTGLILFYIDLPAFSTFIDEDGIVEWLTVIALVGGAVISIKRFFQLRKQKKKLFLTFLLITALVLLFGAGEELSWGQRLFNFQSSKFFEEHNTQKEINIHNLVFGGVKLNKLIFSLFLTVCVILFLFVLPLLYRKSEKIKHVVELCAIPVPRNYQVVSYILLFIVIVIINDLRKWELLEMGSVLLFLSIIQNPLNKELFRVPGKSKEKNRDGE
jgi:hypothetical protein